MPAVPGEYLSASPSNSDSIEINIAIVSSFIFCIRSKKTYISAKS